jgi:hypothetical protein
LTRNFLLALTAVLGAILIAAVSTNAFVTIPVGLKGQAAGGAAPTGNCTQSTAFFTRVWALPATLDGTVGASVGTGTLHLGAYDALICNLVTDGVWATLDALWVPATNTLTGTNTAVANLNLVSSNYTLVAHPGGGSPAFTANAGYTGVDASNTIDLDTGFNGATATGAHWVLNSGAMMVWNFVTTQSSAGGGEIIGNFDGTNLNRITPYYSDGHTYCDVQESSAGAASPTTASAYGAWVCGRNSSTQTYLYNNGAYVANGSTNSVSLVNLNMYLLNWNHSGVADAGAASQVPAASIGGGLNATTPPAISSSGAIGGSGLVPRVCTYLTAVHGSC